MILSLPKSLPAFCLKIRKSKKASNSSRYCGDISSTLSFTAACRWPNGARRRGLPGRPGSDSRACSARARKSRQGLASSSPSTASSTPESRPVRWGAPCRAGCQAGLDRTGAARDRSRRAGAARRNWPQLRLRPRGRMLRSAATAVAPACAFWGTCGASFGFAASTPRRK